MSFPRYDQYKDSGVEWLGEVPAHWEVVRIGSLFREVYDEGEDDLPVLSVSIHDGVSDRELRDDEVDRKVTRSEDRSKYKKVVPGDLVYNMMRAWQGGFGTVSVFGMVSPAYVVARPIAKFVTIFVECLLRTPSAVEEMRRHSQGVTDFRLRLYWEEFKTLRLSLPSLQEQSIISAFLDRQTAKIDALVAEQEKLIALLKEKRQAVISHAVTKGLDPTVPMKDSGIEWLGEVPAHWEVRPLGVLSSAVQTGPFGSQLHANDYIDDVIPVINPSNIQNGVLIPDLGCTVSEDVAEQLSNHKLIPGDIIFGRRGEMGRCAVVTEKEAGWLCGTGCLNVRLVKDQVCPTFVATFLRTPLVRDWLLLESVGSTMDNLNAAILSRLRVPLPPMNEQGAIVTYLSQAISKLDSLTAEAQRAITLLKEHRAALISAAVTGKIDVRGLVDAEAA